jgi:hypothetical protein
MERAAVAVGGGGGGEAPPSFSRMTWGWVERRICQRKKTSAEADALHPA